MAKASALLVAIAACGSLPVEASHMKRLADGPLVAYHDEDDRLLVAPRGCKDATCMAVVGKDDREAWFSKIEPLAPDRWYLVRRSWSSQSWHGNGYGDLGTIVQLAIPPRVGCTLPISSDGCNSEWGYCERSNTTLVPGGDGTFTAITRETGGREPTLGVRTTCERLAIGPKGCEVHEAACP